LLCLFKLLANRHGVPPRTPPIITKKDRPKAKPLVRPIVGVVRKLSSPAPSGRGYLRMVAKGNVTAWSPGRPAEIFTAPAAL
jgi:hypothetical protein